MKNKEISARKHFLEYGYTIIENVINKDNQKELLNALQIISTKFGARYNSRIHSWNDPKLHEQLLYFRYRDRKGFSQVYDILQGSLALKSMFSNSRLLLTVSEVLSKNLAALTTSGYMLRMDSPLDKKNKLGWHQESSYYFQNITGHHGCVIWTPMMKLRQEHGYLNICPYSHLGGKITTESTDALDQISQQHIVPPEVVKKYKSEKVKIPVGSAIMWNMNLFHASGYNESSQFRFAAGVRFHDMSAWDFLPPLSEDRPHPRITRFSNKDESSLQLVK